MEDPRWRMVPVPLLIINDVIVTTLLLLNIIEMLTNWLILFDRILFKYFSNYDYFDGKFDFDNMTS